MHVEDVQELLDKLSYDIGYWSGYYRALLEIEVETKKQRGG